MTADRTTPPRLRLAGAPNARDLGGYRAKGGAVRYGRVTRSGGLSALTDSDVHTLAGLGLRQVIDLRGDGEIALLGADRLPHGCGRAAIPVFDPEIEVYAIISASLRSGQAEQLLSESGGSALMTRMYRGFVASTEARACFGVVLQRMADPRNLPLLVHCTAGKDRTGWLSAILLSLLGVAEDDVTADYTLTNELLGVQARAAVETLCERQGVNDPALIEPLLEARPEYLAAARDEADRRFGSFDRFLSEGLGLSARTRGRLRANLIE